MDALKTLGLCALLGAQQPAAAPCGPVVQISSPDIDRWQTEIDAASKRFDIPVDWIRAVMARESAGRRVLHGMPIVSPAGAMGLMQLMPGTWTEMRTRHGLGDDPFDVRDNIFAGAAYLREMFDRYGYPNLFAAYHAGPGRLDRALAGLKPLPQATQTYLESIVPGTNLTEISGGNRSSMAAKSVSDSLFFVRESREKSVSDNTRSLPNEQGLFVPLASQPVSARH